MAEISFKGFVDDWTKDSPAHPDWAMRVAEPHRKQDNGEWVTVDRTRRTVKAAWGTTIDFTQFKQGDFVEIEGRELTESYGKDGKRFENLVVKATSVALVQKATGESPAEEDVF